jgi:hypothetical protein
MRFISKDIGFFYANSGVGNKVDEDGRIDKVIHEG